jgi:exopolysaccharide biosynthesis polyprenyl glycosylphosphotransferase
VDLKYLEETKPSSAKDNAHSRRLTLPSMGLRVSERRLLLGVVDFTLLFVALVIALSLRTELLPEIRQMFVSWKWILTLAAVWFAYAALFNVYNLARAASTFYSIRSTAMAAALASFTYLVIPWFTPTLVNRSQGYLFVLLSVLFISLWRGAYAQLFTQPTFQRRSIILGTTPGARALVLALRSDFARSDANPFRGTGHILLGFVYSNGEADGENIADLPVLGQAKDLVKLTQELEVDEVILSLPQNTEMGQALYEAILDCHELGIQMTKMSTVYERLTGRVAVEYAGGDVELVAGIEDSAFFRFYAAAKRLIDILSGLFGLLTMLILIPPILVFNALTSPGPLFYKQQRIGQGGKPFRVIKFRSMKPDAEKENGAVWAEKDDGRVTLVGKWLRRLHIDEIPQVINVIKGEMSLVGPRPERSDFVSILAREIPFYRARHSVRPGITGWAQIHQDYGSSIDDARVKLEYDLYYIKKVSLWLDLVIMLRTITRVLGFHGR